MRVVVTGAAGFLGSALVRSLAATHDVIGMIRPGGDAVPGTPSSVTWIEQDLGGASFSLPPLVDCVVHLAQSKHDRDFPERAEDIFAVNVAGAFHLLEAARAAQLGCLVLASSGGVYPTGPAQICEDATPNPESFYAWTKLAMEEMSWRYRSFFPTVVLRLFFPYGPGQRNRLVPRLFERVMAGKPLSLDGPDGIRLNPIHVEDATRAITAAMTLQRHGVFNLAGNEVVTLRELGNAIGRVVGRDPCFERSEGSVALDLVGNNARMRERLGVVPRVGLEAGLAGMWSNGQLA